MFSICHLHLISEIFHDILGPGWKLVYLIDSFYLANREFLGRSARSSFLSAICFSLTALRDISRYFRTRVEACLFDRFVCFGDQIIFYPRIYLINLVRVTPCKFVDLADSFYSANGKCYLRPNK